MAGARRPSVEELWLTMLGQIVGRAAHEVKGALNGVSVNLEVVRLRSGRPDAPAAAVSTFAQTAAGQLDSLTAMTEALLALGRPPRPPVELATVLRNLGALLVPAAKAEGVALDVPGRLEQAHPLAVPGAVARLLLGAALLACIEERRDAAVAVSDGSPDTIAVSVRPTDGRGLELGDRMAAVATEAGVVVGAGDAGITLTFPRAQSRVHERA